MRSTLGLAALTAIAVTACGGSGALEWGPLALADGTGDMAHNEGVVVITDACVFLLERDDERGLLVWRADRTRWHPGEETISFTTLEGGEVTAETIQWARRPAPECVTDGTWFVTDIE